MNAEEFKKAREMCETAEWNLRDNGDIGIEFIEFVRTALPAALGEIERLQKENEIMSEALEKLSRLGAGDRLGNSLTKGQRALVDGRLQIRSYEAKDGSGKRWVTEVIASTVQFLDRKASESNLHNTQNANDGMESFGSPVAFDEEIPF